MPVWEKAVMAVAVNSRAKGEVWKDIPHLEGFYQASNLGNIRSLPRATTKGCVLKQHVHKKNGYCYVSISKHGHIHTRRVHILVANAFLGENTERLQVNHIDGVKTNNAVSNLEYCTQSENMAHAYRTGLEIPKGLSVIDLDTLDVYASASEAARSISSKSRGEMVAKVCRGERSHYRNHRFAFYADYLYGCIPPFKGKNKRKASEALWR
jgi:hypothetical protein